MEPRDRAADLDALVGIYVAACTLGLPGTDDVGFWQSPSSRYAERLLWDVPERLRARWARLKRVEKRLLGRKRS